MITSESMQSPGMRPPSRSTSRSRSDGAAVASGWSRLMTVRDGCHDQLGSTARWSRPSLARIAGRTCSHYTSIAELAAAECINPSYLARVLRLTLLARDIVEEIMSGRWPHGLGTETLLRPFPVEWDTQRRALPK